MSDIIISPNSNEAVSKGWAETDRTDTWWFVPMSQAVVLLALIAYSIWAVVWGFKYAKADPYLSPLFVPDIEVSWWPQRLSPGILSIWIPIGMRATCYYARKVYYRVFFFDPPACAVGEPRGARRNYKGETALPFVLNNIHRYFFYLSAIVVIFHWITVFNAFRFEDGFGIGVGSLVLLINAYFLSYYVFSCHASKHFFGGGVDCYSCSAFGKARYKSWRFIKRMNKNHNIEFWISLFTVSLADLYVRLVAMNVITDLRLI